MKLLPFCAAQNNGVSFIALVALTFAPAFINASTTYSFPENWKSRFFKKSVQILILNSYDNLKWKSQPSNAEKCRGVFPDLSTASSVAPFFMRSSVINPLPELCNKINSHIATIQFNEKHEKKTMIYGHTVISCIQWREKNIINEKSELLFIWIQACSTTVESSSAHSIVQLSLCKLMLICKIRLNIIKVT